MNRREMIKTGVGAAALTILGGIPLHAKSKRDRKKILVFGAHPDDPETGADSCQVRCHQSFVWARDSFTSVPTGLAYTIRTYLSLDILRRRQLSSTKPGASE